MKPDWLLLRVPDWSLVVRLADHFERTGEGESEFTAAFHIMTRKAEVLLEYAAACGGRPSTS